MFYSKDQIDFQFKDKKLERKLAYIWKQLINPKNYFTPQTFDEFRSIDLLEIRLKVDCKDWFFREKIKPSIKDFCSIIYSINEVRNTVIYSTVKKAVLKELEVELQSKSTLSSAREFKDVLEVIFHNIGVQRNKFNFYFSLSGVEFSDLENLDFESVQVKIFTDKLEEVYSKCFNYESNEDSAKRISGFVKNNFLGKPCIQCFSFGDFYKAKEVAEIKAREIVNFLRFLICIFHPQEICRNLVRVDISSEVFVEGHNSLTINEDLNSVILSSGRTKRSLQRLKIDKNKIEIIEEKAFLKEYKQILGKDIDKRTDVEGCILTSIYWLGEAQHEFNQDVSFLKCWTALECIFSYKDKNITYSLAKGVAILAAFSSGFIEISNIEQVYQRVSSLYKARSKLIHRGLRGNVSELDLVEICKYATWTILGLLNLHSHGYKTLSQIDEETERLYNLLSNQGAK